MPTNILALPLAHIFVETNNNENWVDSIKFLVGEEPGAPQLDLRGIAFEMEVRRTTIDKEVVISGSTRDSTLMIGAPPDYGFLIISIPAETMKKQRAGSYVGDIVGQADNYTRVAIQIDLTIIEGVTKWPSPA